MSGSDRSAAAVEALRAAFDASFASVPPLRSADEEALLAIRVGSDPAAIRVRDAASLLKAGRIVPVPSRRAELLGLIGVRGSVVPVYSLAKLTGRDDVEPPRWIVLAGETDRIGIAFAGFERHVRVARAGIHAPGQPSTAGAHVLGAVELEGVFRPIFDVPAIVRAVTAPAVGTGG